ncbi:MAG: glycosyltransferase family 2 protein [Candidatus Omnitrophota bacterium]
MNANFSNGGASKKSGTGATSNGGVSIVIPVYNEAESLPGFIEELSAFLRDYPRPFEAIFVDDGSSDDTPLILEKGPFPFLRREENLGYGAAIKTGIENTGYESIAIIDADGSYPPEEIAAVVERLDGCAMAVGARTGDDVHIPWQRRPAKRLIGLFASWLVRRSIPDLNSGLRAFQRREVEKIVRLLPDGFSLTTTLTVAFLASGRRVYYHPIRYRKRSGRSKFRPFADTWNMILLILRTVVLIRPLNVFLPLSLFLAALAIAVLVVSKVFLDRFMDATFIVLMTSSIQMFVLGLIADLIVRINLWTH